MGAQSYSSLSDPIDYSPPVSSVHGISQARILEWVAISFSSESSQPRAQTCVFCLTGRFFTTESSGKPGLQVTELFWKSFYLILTTNLRGTSYSLLVTSEETVSSPRRSLCFPSCSSILPPASSKTALQITPRTPDHSLDSRSLPGFQNTPGPVGSSNACFSGARLQPGKRQEKKKKSVPH